VWKNVDVWGGLVSGLAGVKAEWLTDSWQMAMKTVHVQKRILNTGETRAAGCCTCTPVSSSILNFKNKLEWKDTRSNCVVYWTKDTGCCCLRLHVRASIILPIVSLSRSGNLTNCHGHLLFFSYGSYPGIECSIAVAGSSHHGVRHLS
jgi:hypothetical protein